MSENTTRSSVGESSDSRSETDGPDTTLSVVQGTPSEAMTAFGIDTMQVSHTYNDHPDERIQTSVCTLVEVMVAMGWTRLTHEIVGGLVIRSLRLMIEIRKTVVDSSSNTLIGSSRITKRYSRILHRWPMKT
jgi:hypothetical protein